MGFHNFNIADPEMRCVVCGEKPRIFIRPGDTYTIRKRMSQK